MHYTRKSYVGHRSPRGSVLSIVHSSLDFCNLQVNLVATADDNNRVDEACTEKDLLDPTCKQR